LFLPNNILILEVQKFRLGQSKEKFEKFTFGVNFSTYMRLQSFRFSDDKSIKRQISEKINF